MTKTELYNKFKQEYYKLDIEAVQARMFALTSVYTDWLEHAQRKEDESQGVFNAMTHILPNWTKYQANEETIALIDELYEKKAELRRITELKAEVA
jgi:hypothetical protein